MSAEFSVIKISKSELDALGLPKRHRCMKCGRNHKIPWDHLRYQGEIVSVGRTHCSCGDEVCSVIGESSSIAYDYYRAHLQKR